eukprot:10260364-Heterocapsa_arctica.AAC.1
MQHPEQHTMLLAAVMGYPRLCPDRAPLTQRGSPTQYASPWLRLWWRDLEQVGQHEPTVREEVSHNDIFALKYSDAFFRFSAEVLHSYQIIHSDARPRDPHRNLNEIEQSQANFHCTVLDENGIACQHEFGTRTGLQRHLILSHNMRNARRLV